MMMMMMSLITAMKAENEPILDMIACDDTHTRSSRSDVPPRESSSSSMLDTFVQTEIAPQRSDFSLR